MPTARSARLRLRDARRVFRLLGEVRELRDQPVLQRQRAIDGLCGLLGAWQGFAVNFEGFTALESVTVTRMVPGGWPDAKTLEFFVEWASRGRLREDPLVDVSTGMAGPVVAARRAEIVDMQTHLRSGVYQRWYDVAGVGDSMVCFYRKWEAGAADGVAIHRERNEASFTARERNLLRLFNLELYRLYRDGQLDPPSGALDPPLPPRRQQVLRALLQGHGVKQIAQHLGLSRRTVDEHIGLLYEQFRVSTRPELMACFVPAMAADT